MGFCISKISVVAAGRRKPFNHGRASPSSFRSRLTASRAASPHGTEAHALRDATQENVQSFEEQEEMIDEVRGPFKTIEQIASFEWMVDANKPPMPEGPKETSKRRMRHYLLKHVMNTNYRSPIEEMLRKGGRVLDVGCGSGIWCVEIAKAFPNATIYGIDTIAHFETKDVPDNCYIQVADALDLPFEESTFDFIFMRGLIFDIKALNYKELVTNMVTLLKPGGYIELNEQDVRLRNAGPITAKFIDLETMAFDTEGFDSRLTRRMHKFLVRDSRITDVKTTFYSIPVGKQWAEPVAGLAAADLLREYRGKREWVAPRVGIDLTDYDDIVDSVKREFMTAETTYVNYRIVYGRKIANVERNPSMKGANSTSKFAL